MTFTATFQTTGTLNATFAESSDFTASFDCELAHIPSNYGLITYNGYVLTVS